MIEFIKNVNISSRVNALIIVPPNFMEATSKDSRKAPLFVFFSEKHPFFFLHLPLGCCSVKKSDMPTPYLLRLRYHLEHEFA